MELSELTAYAANKYHISEEHKWKEYPEFSVLSHPATGKCIALLMRLNGGTAQLCDIKCGQKMISSVKKDYLSAPYRMKGDDWIGVRFDSLTEPVTVFRLFDRAIIFGGQNGAMIVFGSELPKKQAEYKDTPLPFAGSLPLPQENKSPERIREMRRLYEYGSGSSAMRDRNFYRQGKFMEDYEDNAPWTGEFQRYFPTYHDLTLEQLRGYFTWRTAARRGEYTSVSTSFAYIYIYELLNGIGADSVQDSLDKLCELEQGYIDSGIGSMGIKLYLRVWMTDLAVINSLPQETAQKYADPMILKKDKALYILRNPKDYSDDEVFDSLFLIGGNKTLSSPVFKKSPQEARHLFAEVWRNASVNYRSGGKKLFSLCFGERRPSRWEPLKNAVYYPRYSMEDRTYELDECRSYILKGRVWSVKCYRQQYFDKKLFEGLLHETDIKLRIYMKAGKPLNERSGDLWAVPFIDKVIEEHEEEKLRAATPKVTIRFDSLDKIRHDARITQDSLLSEEEKAEERLENIPEEKQDDTLSAQLDLYTISEITSETEDITDDKSDISIPADESSVPLDEKQLIILDMLLHNKSVRDIIRSWGMMTEIFAEQINEALFDEIGDTAVECDGDEMTLIEDYREDIIRITGGTA